MVHKRLVKEIKRGGLKGYQENYQKKHYKLKENVVDGSKESDEKYEAAQYGFKEKCSYNVDNSSGSGGPYLLALRKRFPYGNDKEEDDEEYEEDEGDQSLQYREDGNRVIYPPKGRYPVRYIEHIEPGHGTYPTRGTSPGRYVERVEHVEQAPIDYPPGIYVDHPQYKPRVVYTPGIRRYEVYIEQEGDGLEYIPFVEDVPDELEGKRENSSGKGIRKGGINKRKINQKKINKEEIKDHKTNAKVTQQE
ncbi:hypothetical protein C922_04319 [Plasmodium inui San Antonio 1]|uniref:EMP3/KAHRP N-terminal domain-containing protein n=1 Tax=Plasmodium inui San Antonio 1 TaxID=1237626 RepID=W7A8A0_9APIC|nr:hypothetical protein C922_04319 [Plasmodium inui San Antonio 1]EUD65374.1 hypothetical protein C922_04319 [Plasmodium inui San Antonio 1]